MTDTGNRLTYTTWCTRCEREVKVTARAGLTMKYIRCRECGTPTPRDRHNIKPEDYV